MAIDSQTKRRSVHGHSPGAVIAPVPDGTVGAADRAHMAWLYSRDLTVLVPNAPGLEYSFTAGKMHYRFTESRIHYPISVGRLHYRLPLEDQ